jgi:hypothetical protein
MLVQVRTVLWPFLWRLAQYFPCCSLQQEIVSGQKGKPFPPNWDHSHNNVIMAYRMYYQGSERDSTFPPPDPPKEIVVPASKPKTGTDTAYYIAMNNAADGTGEATATEGGPNEDEAVDLAVDAESAEERRQILHEVREHLDLLKQFEGMISEDLLKKRKRDLFSALPSAPPSSSSRGKLRREESTETPKKARAVATEI